MRNLYLRLATCGGAGFAPLAPGTVGAAVGLIPVLILNEWPLIYLVIACVLFFLGVKASSLAEEKFGERDSSKIVIDEAVSIMITFIGHSITLPTICIGFIANRVLDIVKPFPAGRAERLSGGWGVMMDDLVAGVYSNLILWVVWYLWLKNGF